MSDKLKEALNKSRRRTTDGAQAARLRSIGLCSVGSLIRAS